MENTALILITITNVMLVLILGTLAFLIYRLIKGQGSKGTSSPVTPELGLPTEGKESGKEFHPAILDRMKEMQKVRPKRNDLFCPNHTDEPGEATCAVCDRYFCKACIRPFKALHFCKEHLQLIMRHDWDEVLTVKTSTQDPEEGVRLYEIKKQLFEEMNLPTYVETHYKINLDQDYIETYLVVFSIRQNVEDVRRNLSSFTHTPN